MTTDTTQTDGAVDTPTVVVNGQLTAAPAAPDTTIYGGYAPQEPAVTEDNHFVMKPAYYAYAVLAFIVIALLVHFA